MKLKRNKNGSFTIKTKAEAEEALARVVELEEEISPKMNEATALKVAATEWAVSKGVEVVQLDGCYFRQITRYNRTWIATDDDIPTAGGKVKSLQSIVKGKKVKGVPLWQKITKRVPDAEKITEAVGKGWISEKEVEKAFYEKPQKPFLQKYVGDADDAIS